MYIASMYMCGNTLAMADVVVEEEAESSYILSRGRWMMPF
jgi:hypothetical protein